ncbi:hypothetical protein MHBO_000513 [Bonamia ostreae]|uniref:Uncharacterized protein n=1 Tax=Bonamia ostreae TaxID=126728 RepID=A0ABV2AFU2_9EUKA
MNPLHPNFFKTPKLVSKLRGADLDISGKDSNSEGHGKETNKNSHGEPSLFGSEPNMNKKTRFGNRSEDIFFNEDISAGNAKKSFRKIGADNEPIFPKGFSCQIKERVLPLKNSKPLAEAPRTTNSGATETVVNRPKHRKLQNFGKKAENEKIDGTQKHWKLKKLPFKRKRRVPKYPSIDAGASPRLPQLSRASTDSSAPLSPSDLDKLKLYFGQVRGYFGRLRSEQNAVVARAYEDCPVALKEGVCALSGENSNNFLSLVQSAVARLEESVAAWIERKPKTAEKRLERRAAEDRKSILHLLLNAASGRVEKSRRLLKTEGRALALACVQLACSKFCFGSSRVPGDDQNADGKRDLVETVAKAQESSLLRLHERGARLLQKLVVFETRKKMKKEREEREDEKSGSKAKSQSNSELQSIILGLNPKSDSGSEKVVD